MQCFAFYAFRSTNCWVVTMSFFLFTYTELEERQWDSSTSRYVQLEVMLLRTNHNDDFKRNTGCQYRKEK